eukprot:TRINITY_DN17477_c0_g1_i1.p2 TRINITY_DN17477_c0_g1~~TRINITY_DN17477_c0_g1_i1.p2  ORF type:complete len:147 (-),score=44.16 TRINITY_DN17477_c0_g1_i1:170-610(-)
MRNEQGFQPRSIIIPPQTINKLGVLSYNLLTQLDYTIATDVDDTIENGISTLLEQLKVLNQRLEVLEKDKSVTSEKIAALEEKNKEMHQRITILEEENAMMKSNHEEMKRRFDQITTEMGECGQDISARAKKARESEDAYDRGEDI